MPNFDKVIYDKLVHNLKANEEIFQSLIGKNIAIDFGGKTNLIGLVEKIKGNTAFFQTIPHPLQHQTNYDKPYGEFEIFYGNTSPSSLNISDTKHGPFEKFMVCPVYSTLPSKIIASHRRIY